MYLEKREDGVDVKLTAQRQQGGIKEEVTVCVSLQASCTRYITALQFFKCLADNQPVLAQIAFGRFRNQS